MKSVDRKNISQKLLQFLSAAVMCACLLLLTGANFIVYPSENISSIDQRDRESKAPPAPAEEKSSETKAPTSIQEEYLHDHADVELKWINSLSLHKIHAAEKLPLPPGREVYCPPRFC
jgi:hypothetical protein